MITPNHSHNHHLQDLPGLNLLNYGPLERNVVYADLQLTTNSPEGSLQRRQQFRVANGHHHNNALAGATGPAVAIRPPPRDLGPLYASPTKHLGSSSSSNTTTTSSSPMSSSNSNNSSSTCEYAVLRFDKTPSPPSVC